MRMTLNVHLLALELKSYCTLFQRHLKKFPRPALLKSKSQVHWLRSCDIRTFSREPMKIRGLIYKTVPPRRPSLVHGHVFQASLCNVLRSHGNEANQTGSFRICSCIWWSLSARPAKSDTIRPLGPVPSSTCCLSCT